MLEEERQRFEERLRMEAAAEELERKRLEERDAEIERKRQLALRIQLEL